MITIQFTIGYTIFNKEKLINQIVDGLSKLDGVASIFLFDACTDGSLSVFKKRCHKLRNCTVYINEGPDIYETLANNFILEKCKTEYCVLLQDDLILKDGGFLEIADKIYEMDPLAALIGFKDGYEMDSVNQYQNIISSPWSTSKNIKRILESGEYVNRTFVNRGPLIVPKRIISKIGYFDESYYPLFYDDNDYCIRAKKKGFQNYVAYSEIDTNLSWGSTRAGSKIPLQYVWIANQLRFSKKWGIIMPFISRKNVCRAIATSKKMKLTHLITNRKWKKKIKTLVF